MRSIWLGRQVLDGSHVVKPVGELDEDDADVLDDGQEHLAEVLRLLALLALELEARDLRDAVHEFGYLVPELGRKSGKVDLALFDDVVKKARGDRRRVELELGEDLRGHLGVDDVGIAGLAGLPFVRAGGNVVHALDEAEVQPGSSSSSSVGEFGTCASGCVRVSSLARVRGRQALTRRSV